MAVEKNRAIDLCKALKANKEAKAKILEEEKYQAVVKLPKKLQDAAAKILMNEKVLKEAKTKDAERQTLVKEKRQNNWKTLQTTEDQGYSSADFGGGKRQSNCKTENQAGVKDEKIQFSKSLSSRAYGLQKRNH